MNDRRAIPRHRVLKAESIEFDGSSVDCNVPDIGTGIEVASPFGIPHEVTLKNILTRHVRQHCLAQGKTHGDYVPNFGTAQLTFARFWKSM